MILNKKKKKKKKKKTFYFAININSLYKYILCFLINRYLYIYNINIYNQKKK